MRLVVFSLLVLMATITGGIVEAQTRSYSYQNIKLTDDSVKSTFGLTIEAVADGNARFTRTTRGEDYTQIETFEVNADYDTLSWSAESVEHKTNYKGRKEGRVVTIEGKVKGEDISKTLILSDDKPLYITPKFNLMNFVRSDQNQIEFWTLRKDEWTEYLMRAEKLEEKLVTVNGDEVMALKVKYQATGAGAKYYKRSYYYRVADGVFLKRKKKANLMQLVGE